MGVLRGIDCSNWQGGAINWDAVAASGITFAFIKATDGVAYTDGDFSRNWAGAKHAGLVRGAYHYSHVGNSPADETANFLRVVRDLEPSDLVALDSEDGASNGPDISAPALAWLQTVEKAVGFKPILYSYPSYITGRLTSPALAAYPLWLASLTANCPARLGVWPSVTLWQRSWTGQVPGIAGNVDLDQLERSLTGLEALGKPQSSPALLTVITGGALKANDRLTGLPSHSSPAAIDEQRHRVDLKVGQQLVSMSQTVTTDDVWVKARLSLERPVWGYVPQSSIKAA